MAVVLVGGSIGAHRFGAPVDAAARTDVKIAQGAPTSFDPALQSDIGSAAFSAQLFESLTAFDLSLTLRPALAASWDISDSGRQIVFHLRPGLTFSDGGAISGADVVGSWLRIIDPKRPSQLATLFMDVRGAADYVAGKVPASAVGLRADGLDVAVELDRPGADFPAIVASPTFAVVPPQVWRDRAAADSGNIPSSGAYTVSATTATEITLQANSHYWAGPPAVGTIRLLSDLGGRSPITAFEAGDVDYTAIGSADAAWIRYDSTLGPQLRAVPSLSLVYLGFTTTRPPFDDVRVRQAFAAAVDWNRLTALSSLGDVSAADSMLPPGIGAGGSSWLPVLDPSRARALLAAAGYPGGSGFPDVVLAAGGIPQAEGIAADLKRELGVTIHLEELNDQFTRLQDDPPAMWTLGWVADYPGPNDFLGVLLGTGSSNNYGRWSSPPFDAAIADGLGTLDPTVAGSAFERALGIVRDDVPAIPLTYSRGWALSRSGLLGADQNGLGIMRMAAWRGVDVGAQAGRCVARRRPGRDRMAGPRGARSAGGGAERVGADGHCHLPHLDCLQGRSDAHDRRRPG
ncbi:MAG: peptide ABC transporter substrate-binding protein [Chloroflexi bacterium]|nr:peptide ABC transporter substrate-binding protein [Chloroflexota bacterium]